MRKKISSDIVQSKKLKAGLDLNRQIESEYVAARQLLRRNYYKQALKKFKWVFSNDTTSNIFLSRHDAAKLVKHYAPAKTLIKRWRNAKERLVLARKADSRIIDQWATLNSVLGEKERTMNVFLKLKPGDDDDLIHDFLNRLWMIFARSQNYEVLRNYLPTLGFHVLLHAIEYDGIILFPSQGRLSRTTRQWEVEIHRAYMLYQGTVSYEVALALGEKHVAAEFAKKILGVQSNDTVFARLITGAIRAHAFSEAIALFESAKTQLSIRKLPESLKAIEKIPKRWRAG